MASRAQNSGADWKMSDPIEERVYGERVVAVRQPPRPKVARPRIAKPVEPVAPPPPPANLLEDIVNGIESDFEHFSGQLGNLGKAKRVLREALDSEEFTEEQMSTLMLGLKRQESSMAPALEHLSQQIKLAQRAWNRKQALITNAQEGGLLDELTSRQWSDAHEQLADRIDAVIQKLQSTASAESSQLTPAT